MADDQIQRSYRAPDRPGRSASASGNDPLAELARLIGQSDPFAEYGRNTARRSVPPPQANEPAVDWSAPAVRSAHAPIARDYPTPPTARPATPAVEPYEAHYASADDYHGEAGAPGYPLHAEGGDYEHPYEEDAGNAAYAGEDYYDVQPHRHRGLMAIAAVFVLALLGTAAAFGYRMYFGKAFSGPPPIIKADTKPSKIVPVKKDTAKLIQERMPAQGEKLVTREEKPIDIQDKPTGVFAPSQPGAQVNAAQAPILGSGVIGGQPKKVHTIIIRPDQPNGAAPVEAAVPPPATITAINPAAVPPEQNVASVPPAAPAPQQPVAQPAPQSPIAQAALPPRAAKPAPQQHRVAQAAPRHPMPQSEHRIAAAPRNAPLSLSPTAPAQAAPVHAAPMRLASVAPRHTETRATHIAGGYAVQVSSRRSESDAEAAFRSMQAKYPNQLRGQHSLIRRVDLGQKGVYYRTMIGPFASSEQASKLCNSLKAAGGHCFVQRI